jgi:hypothetical protein
VSIFVQIDLRERTEEDQLESLGQRTVEIFERTGEETKYDGTERTEEQGKSDGGRD